MLFALLEKTCVLVTLTFVLTQTRLFTHLLRPRLPIREQVMAFLFFLVMGLTEVAVAHQLSLMNARIIAVCAAGLLAGPWIGGIMGVAVTVIACLSQKLPVLAIGLSMVMGGLAGGLLHRWKPSLALHPATGFVLGALTSLARFSLVRDPAQNLLGEATLHGGGVALILLVVAQVRAQERQARAAAMAEVQALQARMNPHFMFNALNTLSALSLLEPQTVPRAAARLGLFLRASLDQHERPFISLQEELDVIAAYLDIEALRMGERLFVEQKIAPGLLEAPVPPFLLQPLVENAVCHGIQPRAEGGCIYCTAQRAGVWLVLTVSDTGVGISSEAQARLFQTGSPHVHALTLLRRRLLSLYGSAFALTLESCPGEGTTVSIRIPLQRSKLLPATNFAATPATRQTADTRITLLSP